MRPSWTGCGSASETSASWPLVEAFLKAGILSGWRPAETPTGTPQGGILSPLLANIALSVLDDHFAEAWASFGMNAQDRQHRRRKGLPTYRLVRYAV